MSDLQRGVYSTSGSSLEIPLPYHTQEFYIPLRRNYSFQSVLQLIELAIILDDIEMLRDRFMGKQGTESKVSDGFRSVVGTGAWQKLKETAAM